MTFPLWVVALAFSAGLMLGGAFVLARLRLTENDGEEEGWEP